jgi:putative transposase
LARQKECLIKEGHLMPDHVHMMISIPPKYSVSNVIGYFASKVGRDEKVTREYIRHQETEDIRVDQLLLV